MKTSSKVSALFVATCLTAVTAVSIQAQGTFQNLDFEAATIIPVGSIFTQFGPAFSGWTAYYNSTALDPTTPVTYNNQRSGTAGLGIRNMVTGGAQPIFNYTAVLDGGVAVNDVDVTLAQTGLVPVGTLSLRFQANRVFPDRPFTITIGGQPLTPAVVQVFGNFQEYGANIPAGLAGQSAELRFTQGHGQAGANNFYLDNISFSNVGVPEPGTWALLMLGGALLWCGGRRRRK